MVRDLEKAQHTKLRWQSYHEPGKSTNTRASVKSAPAKSSAAKKKVASPSKKAVAAKPARTRAEEHARREASHIAQTSATKPKDDPFSDPFFDDHDSGPRLAARPKVKVDPVLVQPPDRLEPSRPAGEPLVSPSDMPLAEPDDTIDLEPLPDGAMSPDEQAESAEQPEPDADLESEFGDREKKEDFMTQGYDLGQLPPCPNPADVKQIREITTDISAQAGEFPPECPLGNVGYTPREFASTTFTWKASALCSKPLYFQQAALERYGHSWGPLLQPVISGVDFYARIFALPYMMGMDPPCQCVYALGWYRPGSCAPMACYPIPISLRGGLVEAGVILGAVALIP